LSLPEPIEAVAILPEAPPSRFRWRHRLHWIARAEGPERIAAEWWRAEDAGKHPRDYYRVEDREGRRFWLYRDRPYGVGAPLRWWLHGVFA
jgi:protein ImuB